MYNYNQLESFIDKIQKEAIAAADAVLNKYEPELIERIKKQLNKGDTLVSGMGTAFVKGASGEIKDTVNDNFTMSLAGIQYNDFVGTGFALPDITK